MSVYCKHNFNSIYRFVFSGSANISVAPINLLFMRILVCKIDYTLNIAELNLNCLLSQFKYVITSKYAADELKQQPSKCTCSPVSKVGTPPCQQEIMIANVCQWTQRPKLFISTLDLKVICNFKHLLSSV